MSNQLPTLYLCGPMSGLPEHNHPAFNKAATKLRQLGFEVINPTENGLQADAPWEEHMAADLVILISKANAETIAIATVPGLNVLDQPNSKGMRLELAIAEYMGLSVASTNDWLAFGKGYRLANPLPTMKESAA